MKLRILILTLIMTVGFSATALADNITIFDNHSSSGTCTVGNCEDDETEPGTIQSQVWDLEAFFLNGNVLSMIGGYNFKDGVTHNDKLYKRGDIFINTTGSVSYGAGTDPINGALGCGPHGNECIGSNNAGWDYAIRLTFTGNTGGDYDVYSINSTTLVVAPSDIQVNSQPWKVKDSQLGTQYAVLVSEGAFTFGQVPDGPGYTGWTGGSVHYKVDGLNLGFLGSDQDFTVKTTMQCGNDNLIGEGTTTVPEPTSLVLLGIGGLLAGALRYRRSAGK
jgi:hypothetical protein